jgi:hypothetical protein
VDGRWAFQAVYWLVMANAMELVADVSMRSFSGHGDIAIMHRGIGISSWS